MNYYFKTTLSNFSYHKKILNVWIITRNYNYYWITNSSTFPSTLLSTGFKSIHLHSKLLEHKLNGVDGSRSFTFGAPKALGPQLHSQLQVSTITLAKDSASFVFHMIFYLVYNFFSFWDDFFPCSHLKYYVQTPS